MRLGAVVAPIVVALAFAFAGCGSHGANVASNPQAKQAATSAEALLQGCLHKGNLITSKGRNAVVRCIAPPGQQAALESCISNAASKDHFFTKKQRIRLGEDTLACIEAHR